MADMKQQDKPNRVWRIVLVSSLAVNLLMIGVIGGSVVRGGGRPPAGFELQLGSLTTALSQKDRRAIGDQIRRNASRSGQIRSERREAVEALMRALEAQPFDAETLELVIRSQQDRQSELQGTALDAFVSHISDMTAEERTDFVKRLRENYARRGDRNDRRPPPETNNSGG
jgi:uncharacterized membrane protein